MIVVGLAGHGIQPLGSKEAYFCPRDANPTIEATSRRSPKRWWPWVRFSSNWTTAASVTSCSWSTPAATIRTSVVVGASNGSTSRPCHRRPACSWLFSGRVLVRGQVARERPRVFFCHVIQGLKGAAKDAEDSDISWDLDYVKKKVPATVKSLFGKNGGEQRPNDIGNLIGEPTVLAIAPVGTRPEPKPLPEPMPSREPTPASGTFSGTRRPDSCKDNDLKNGAGLDSRRANS